MRAFSRFAFERILAVAVLALPGALLPGLSRAASEQLALAEDAIAVLREIREVPEQRIPRWLLADAAGVAVIPNVIKAGFVVGGRRGKGLLSVRDADGGWSHPNFITLTGGSFGFQAGVQASDVVLVFKTRRSIEDLVRGKFTLGADASVAAGPVGRDAAAATDLTLKAEIYAYSRSRGLFAGVALDGSALTIDHRANEAVYGEDITPRRIFAGAVGSVGDAVTAFRRQLSQQLVEP